MRRLLALALGAWLAALPGPPAQADSADALALAQALRLPPAAMRQLEAHARLLMALTAPHEPGAHEACDLLASADALRARLFDALAPRLAEAGSDERHLHRELLRGLARALPGVGARLPVAADAPLEAGVDHAALAAALPARAPGRALLAVAGGLRDPAGAPAYLRPTSLAGEPGCADFGRVLGPLGQLPAAWQAAPSCLRTRLLAPLREAVVKMGEQAEFCQDEPVARAQAKAAARLLAKLQAFGGPGTGKRIGHNFRSYGLRFGLAP